MIFSPGKTTYPWLNLLLAPCDQCSSGHWKALGVEKRTLWALWSSLQISVPRFSHVTLPGNGRHGLKHLAQHSGHVKLEGGFSVSTETHLLVSTAPRPRFYKLSGPFREGPHVFHFWTLPHLQPGGRLSL